MKRFVFICGMEFLLLIRNFFGFFFGLIFPVMMLILFGTIFENTPVELGSALRMMDLCVPGYTVMVMGVAGLMSFPLTLAECKERKIYKRFDATPVGKGYIILAQITVNLLLTAMGILILLVAGGFLYRVRIQGGPMAICGAGALSVASMFSMGFFFTAVGRDAKISYLLCYLFYFIMLFLSGATIPDSIFPDSVRRISGFLPMTYAVDLMQGVFAGDNLGTHGRELAILGSLTIGFLGLGAILYKRQPTTS